MTSSREADLIAAIVAAPDDPAAFLVYADFLQSKGDPRGELITLMHAGEKSAQKHLGAHKAAFLGKLAKQSSSIKLEAWRLGFVDHVKLVADTELHALQLIDEVVDHPSTRFMRTLEVVIIGKRRSYAGVDARLVELGRPQTLSKIVLGKPGDHALSAAIEETFPRVAAVPKKTWDELAAAIKSVRRAGPGFAADTIAQLNVPIETGEIVRALGAEIDGKQRIGLVGKLLADVKPDELDHFAASLVTAWATAGEESRTAWVLDAASMLGGARAARAIARRFADVSHPRATQQVDCLARMRTPLATLELFAASRHWATRGEYAETTLANMARRAKLDLPTLLARAGSDPRDAFDDDTLARFRELDMRVLEYLVASGWSAPHAMVAELFEHAPRAAWCKSLVWRKTATETALVHPADEKPPHDTLESLAELVSWDLNIEALRTRGYRNGGLKNEVHEEQRFVKTHVYRGTSYTLAITPSWGNTRVTAIPNALPPVVLYELARDVRAALR